MSEVKEFTVRQVFEALAQNGFYHLRDTWTADDMHGVIDGGCVLHQGAMNLGVLSSKDTNEYSEEFIDSDIEEYEAEAKYLKYNIQDQLNKWSVRPGSKWAPEVYSGDFVEQARDRRRLGNVIMYWNDLSSYDEKEDVSIYHLSTYEDVIKMAEEVLKPHMDKTIKLLARTWKYKKVVNV